MISPLNPYKNRVYRPTSDRRSRINNINGIKMVA